MLWSSVGEISCCLCLTLGLVSFLLAHVSWIPASVQVGMGVEWGCSEGFPHCPCLSAWLSGCSQVTSKCTPVPTLPALLRHRGNSPGRGACLGSSVESSPRCTETSLSSLPQAPSPQHLEGGGLFSRSPFQALHAYPSQLKASGGLSPEKEFSLSLGLFSKPKNKMVKAELIAI